MESYLNERILKALIKEEHNTAQRYYALGQKYNIPDLIEAASQEDMHKLLFQRILQSRRFK